METVQKHPIAKGLFYALIVCASIQLFGVLAYISAWILPDKLISTIFFILYFVPLNKIVVYIFLYNTLPLFILTVVTWCNRQKLETVLKNPKTYNHNQYFIHNHDCGNRLYYLNKYLDNFIW